MKKGDKKATILVENTIFTILNLAFLSILILFILNQGNQDNLLEERYAKQIAFIIDSAKPGMEIQLDMSDAQKSMINNEIPFESVVSVINGDNLCLISSFWLYETLACALPY